MFDPRCLRRWRGQRIASEAEGVAPAPGASSSPSPTTASGHQPQFFPELHLLFLWAATAPVTSLPCWTYSKPHAALETDTLLKEQCWVDNIFLHIGRQSALFNHIILFISDTDFFLSLLNYQGVVGEVYEPMRHPGHPVKSACMNFWNKTYCVLHLYAQFVLEFIHYFLMSWGFETLAFFSFGVVIKRMIKTS